MIAAAVAKPVIIGLAVALGLSVAANTALGWAWLGARDDLATARAELTQSRADAKQCSDGTADLRKRAEDAEKAAATARRAAQAARVERNKRADAILTAPPTVPGDDCRSAGDRFNNWLGVAK